MSLFSAIADGINAVNSVVRQGEAIYSQVKPIISTAQTIQNLFKKPTPIPAIVAPAILPALPPPPTTQQVAYDAPPTGGISLGSVQPVRVAATEAPGLSPATMGLYALVAVLVVVLLIKK